MKTNILVSIVSFLCTVMVVVWFFKGTVNAEQTEPTTQQNQPGAVTKTYEVQIRDIGGTPRIETGYNDSSGKPITVSCTTCHQTRTPNFDNKSGDDLDEFHQGLTMQHGDLSCLSCHNQDNYDTLRLSDGREVQYKDAMKLCAQCHGTQFRDYQHGAHGGMTGYWSLEKGPRIRNNCMHCHDPHYPKYQLVSPVLPPKDRFLTNDNHE